MSGRDAKFSSFSRFDPHLCQEEEKAISSRLVVPARSSDFPQTVPVTAVSVPQLQLQSEPQTQSQIQAHSLLQPQSEPQAQGSTARLPPAGSSPGEAREKWRPSTPGGTRPITWRNTTLTNFHPKGEN